MFPDKLLKNQLHLGLLKNTKTEAALPGYNDLFKDISKNFKTLTYTEMETKVRNQIQKLIRTRSPRKDGGSRKDGGPGNNKKRKDNSKGDSGSKFNEDLKGLGVLMRVKNARQVLASHSLCREGATSLFNAGVSATYIREWGRWSRDMWVTVYAQLSFDRQLELTKAFPGVGLRVTL